MSGLEALTKKSIELSGRDIRTSMFGNGQDLSYKLPLFVDMPSILSLRRART